MNTKIAISAALMFGVALGFLGGLYAFSPSTQRSVTTAATYAIIDPKSRAMLASGWSGVESWGVWSDGPRAELSVPLPKTVLADFEIALEGPLHWVKGHKENQHVSIRANNQPVGKWSLPNSPRYLIRIKVPRTMVEQSTVVSLLIDIADTRSPRDLNVSGDARRLGIGLETVSVSY